MRKMKMESKQEPLTLVEAEREFGKVLRAFDAYLEKTKHLGQNAVLVAEIGEYGYSRSSDPDVPWVPLLYVAANLMDRDDCTQKNQADLRGFHQGRGHGAGCRSRPGADHGTL